MYGNDVPELDNNLGRKTKTPFRCAGGQKKDLRNIVEDYRRVLVCTYFAEVIHDHETADHGNSRKPEF